MSALGLSAPAAFDRSADGGRAGPLASRLLAYGALALFASWQWALLAAPAPRGRLVLAAAVACATALGAHRTLRLDRVRRALVLVALGIAALVLVLICAGLPVRLLAPARWGDLAAGVAQGLQSLPGVGVPYRGVDPWVRLVLVVACGLLLTVAGGLAVRALHRGVRPLGAAIVLATVFTIPVVEHTPSHPYAWGAAFTVLVGGLLWGDRLERAHLAPAAVFVGVAVIGGAVVAPGLDANRPWIDYQGIVESLNAPPAIAFDWNHSYGPLDWPRDNRVLLRVAAPGPAYWKAVDLDAFDGVRWRAQASPPQGADTQTAPHHDNWHATLRVSVRDLRSSAYVGAGTTLAIRHSPRLVLPSAPGTYATGREPLRRGDTYLTEVYTPHPSLHELSAAGTGYPAFTARYLSMDLPPSVGGPDPTVPGTPSALGPVRLEFPNFSLRSHTSPPAAVNPRLRIAIDGDPLLRASQYAPLYALARRLRAQARTPYDLIRAVQAKLAGGYAYTEHPPRPLAHRPPLVSFLFDGRAGYCQQFSGAMALLLRMGGVPARVAAGFAPGTFDDGRKEWVVRDIDAHSWVEAYVPKIGWITLDPTPGVAPPRSQLANTPLPSTTRDLARRPDARRGDVPAAVPEAEAPRSPGDATVSMWALLAGALLAGMLGGAGVYAVRSRRRPEPVAHELAELERALRRTGRSPHPPMTLRALEHRYAAHAPLAAGYVAAVRLERFGGRREGPTREQRAGLRAELAAGLGPAGRLRSWWALPPGRRGRPRVYNEGG